jgi:predicted HTH transcriptional regulator
MFFVVPGYGFDKMLQWKRQTGNEVLFETTIDKTKFIFMLDAAGANRKKGIKSGTKNDEGGMKSGTIAPSSGTTGKILLLIASYNTISLTQLSKELGINRSAIQKHIDNLKSKGIIRRDGADKGGKWIIIEQ